jgi:hypothetical protein
VGTTEQLAAIQRMAHLPSREIGEAIGLSEFAVRRRASAHGIRLTSRGRNTSGTIQAQEAEVIRRVYPSGGYPAVHRECPHLTERAVSSWAWRHNVARVRGSKPRKKRERKPLDVWSNLPAQDVLQQLECLRFRKWRGPVNTERPLVATIGRVAA